MSADGTAPRDPTVVEPRISPLRQSLKRHRLGRMAAALWRRRRLPTALVRARAAETMDRRHGRIPPPVPRRRECQAMIFIPSGPGDPELVMDTIDSALASDGGENPVLVVDDCSVSTREAVIRERFPQVEVVRTRVPSGGPPNVWPQHRMAIEHALANYDFQLLVKLDADALVTGPDLSESLARRLAADPEVGQAGSFLTRADGAAEASKFHAEALGRELGSDRTLAGAAQLAEANGWRRGDCVQGGAFAITRAACEAMRDEGWLAWPRPWHSQVADDPALTMFVFACGLQALSIGDPTERLVAVANKGLPLAKEELADGPWVAAHSVRAGLHGETEQELRAFFRARRAGWAKPAENPGEQRVGRSG